MNKMINTFKNKWTFFLYLVLFSLSYIPTFAQKRSIDEYKKVKITKQNDKYGIKADGDWKIEPQYDNILPKVFSQKATLWAQHCYLAYKGELIDVYSQFTLYPIINNIQIRDTSQIYELAALCYLEREVYPFFENGLLGWRYKDIVVPAKYDSLKRLWADQIIVFKNGKMGLTELNGSLIVEPGDYTEFAKHGYYYTTTFLENKQSGLVLQGMSFRSNYVIPPVYDTIVYVQYYYKFKGKEANNILIGVLPNGKFEGYYPGTGYDEIVKLPDEIANSFKQNYFANFPKERSNFYSRIGRLKWMDGLYFESQKGSLAILNQKGETLLPYAATAVEIGITEFDPDDGSIAVGLTSDKPTDFKPTFTGRYKLINNTGGTSNAFHASYPVMLEINPYNSMSADYRFYFNVEFTPDFDYKADIHLPGEKCPVCDGAGQKDDGYNVISNTITYNRIVKDGKTTITRKNYLANERVDANGRVYVPTYEQSYDKYKTVKETVTNNTYIRKYKPCPLCNGAKKYQSGYVIWDEARKEYVLKTLVF